MAFSPRVRQLALTVHLTSSIGWIGAAVAFLGLAVIGLTSENETAVRGVYLVMDPAAWIVLVPLAFGSLISGIVVSLGTPWGLFRHYWVVFKLLITLFSTLVLLTYTTTFRQMAAAAADAATPLSAVRNASPALHAVLAAVLLITATILAVYKPSGVTPLGRSASQATPPTPTWARAFGFVSAAVAVAYVVVHLHGGGPAMHVAH